MRKDTSLPLEFQGLVGKVQYVAQWTREEWSSSCPLCGGVPHKDGTYPDRFRMWTNANGKNKVMGWCRHCGFVWFPDKDKAPDPQEFERWRKEQITREEERRREAEQAIKLLKSQKIWEQYHANIGQSLARQTLADWGVPQEYADAWQLGFIPDYTVFSKQNGEYHSPAMTIPVWQPDWNISNVKVRVLNPKSQHDRYRKLYKTGTDAPFWTRPALKSDTCLIVEGEKKAMVCSVYIDEIQVVGIPTKTPNSELMAQFANFKKVYLCLDPDANQDTSLSRAVSMLGKFRTYVVNLPDKVDDMINKHSLNIVDALKYAKRATEVV